MVSPQLSEGIETHIILGVGPLHCLSGITLLWAIEFWNRQRKMDVTGLHV